MRVELNEVPAVFLSDFSGDGILKKRFLNRFKAVKPTLLAVLGKIRDSKFYPLSVMGLRSSKLLGIKVHSLYGPYFTDGLTEEEKEGMEAVLTLVLLAFGEKGSKQDLESVKKRFPSLSEVEDGSFERFLGTSAVKASPIFGGLVRHLVTSFSENGKGVSVIVNGKEAFILFENALDRFVRTVEKYIYNPISSYPFLLRGDKSISERDINIVASSLSTSIFAVAKEELGLHAEEDTALKTEEEISQEEEFGPAAQIEKPLVEDMEIESVDMDDSGQEISVSNVVNEEMVKEKTQTGAEVYSEEETTPYDVSHGPSEMTIEIEEDIVETIEVPHIESGEETGFSEKTESSGEEQPEQEVFIFDDSQDSATETAEFSPQGEQETQEQSSEEFEFVSFDGEETEVQEERTESSSQEEYETAQGTFSDGETYEGVQDEPCEKDNEKSESAEIKLNEIKEDEEEGVAIFIPDWESEDTPEELQGRSKG